MSYKVLTSEQVEQFITKGYVRLEAAFDLQDALAVQDFLWEKIKPQGIERSDPATWTKPMVHLMETFHGPEFQACATQRLADAVEDLVGAGRWARRNQAEAWGWFPINFSVGANEPWTVPTVDWHWDGMHFRHYLDAPDQGLLMLCFFSENTSRGGVTLVAEGTHRILARFLAQFPEGIEQKEAIPQCSRSHSWLAELTGATFDNRSPEERVAYFMEQTTVDPDGTELRVVEAVSKPGDIYLCHPFLYHSSSQNHLRIPRFMCNRVTPLKERMKFDREEGDYSPVESSIRAALGMK